MGTGSSLSGVLAPFYGIGTRSSLSGVHPPSFGWALEALCLGSIHPPSDGHWKLSVWRPCTILWNGHWKLSVWGPSTLLWTGTGSSLSRVHSPSFGWALEALCLASLHHSMEWALEALCLGLDGDWKLSMGETSGAWSWPLMYIYCRRLRKGDTVVPLSLTPRWCVGWLIRHWGSFRFIYWSIRQTFAACGFLRTLWERCTCSSIGHLSVSYSVNEI